MTSDDARDAERWVLEAGRRVVLFAGDLAEPQTCRDLVDAAVAEFGRIDILVSNAAFQMTHETVEEISDEEWDRTLAVNLSAYFHLVKAALPHIGALGALPRLGRDEAGVMQDAADRGGRGWPDGLLLEVPSDRDRACVMSGCGEGSA